MKHFAKLAWLLVFSSGNFAAAQWGTLKGTVVLDGAVPKIEPLFLKGADKKDPNVCAAQDMPNESVLVDPETKGIANVVVWLVKKPGRIHPDLAKPEPAVVNFDHVKCRFSPHVMVVRTNQELKVLNGDKIAHNARFGFVKNAVFGDIVAPPDPKGHIREFKFAEKLPIPVTCDIHPWMKAYLMIVDHPYATVTNPEGVFEIKNLPAGEHEFKFWHENPGDLIRNPKDPKTSMRVTIKSGETLEIPEIKVPVEKILEK